MEKLKQLSKEVRRACDIIIIISSIILASNNNIAQDHYYLSYSLIPRQNRNSKYVKVICMFKISWIFLKASCRGHEHASIFSGRKKSYYICLDLELSLLFQDSIIKCIYTPI